MVTVMTDKSQSSKITNANTWQWIVDSQKHTVCAHIYQGLVNVKTPLILPGELQAFRAVASPVATGQPKEGLLRDLADVLLIFPGEFQAFWPVATVPARFAVVVDDVLLTLRARAARARRLGRCRPARELRVN